MAWPEKGLKLHKISHFGLEMKSHPWAPLPVFLNYCGLYEAEGRSCLEVLKIGPKFRWHFNWKLWNRQYQCSWAVAHELMSAALRCTRNWCTQRSEGHWYLTGDIRQSETEISFLALTQLATKLFSIMSAYPKAVVKSALNFGPASQLKKRSNQLES